MIDLLNLAKKAENLHREINCSFGTIKVYHVPDVILLSAKLSYSEPQQPMVRMKTATGFQDRLSKPGDEEYEKWQSEWQDYQTDLIRMRTATRLVYALRDLSYPDTSKPPTKMANEIYNGNWPDNIVMQKKIWLDFTIMSNRSDSTLIYNALDEMAGIMDVTEEMVDEVKKNSE